MNFRIKEIAQSKGITQVKLAELLGVSEANVKYYYLTKTLNTQTLEKLADALNVQVWELLATPHEILATLKGSVEMDGKRIPLRQLALSYIDKDISTTMETDEESDVTPEASEEETSTDDTPLENEEPADTQES